jgi:hypothetical protein
MAAQALGELSSLDQREILSKLSIPILSFVGAKDLVVTRMSDAAPKRVTQQLKLSTWQGPDIRRLVTKP